MSIQHDRAAGVGSSLLQVVRQLGAGYRNRHGVVGPCMGASCSSRHDAPTQVLVATLRHVRCRRQSSGNSQSSTRTIPNFDAPLSGLRWHVLTKGEAPLEANHSFINAQILSRSVGGSETCWQKVQQIRQLVQAVKVWLSTRRHVVVVADVEVLRELQVPGLWHGT